tara:strand:+ start:423 stop:602 length:180 start_codon:yes stop_codon:yes gene_type:complete
MAKKKIREFFAGKCNVCNQQYLTTDGNWIINAERKLFCHEPCFDIYVRNNQKEKYYAKR